MRSLPVPYSGKHTFEVFGSVGIRGMSRQAPIQFGALGLGNRELIRISADAFPDVFHQPKTLLNRQPGDLIFRHRAHDSNVPTRQQIQATTRPLTMSMMTRCLGLDTSAYQPWEVPRPDCWISFMRLRLGL